MAVITSTQAGSVDAVAMLDTIAWSEGADYDTIVTGVGDPKGGEHFTDFSQHPFAAGRPAKLVVAPGARFPNGLRSSAAGRYQFMLATWQDLQRRLGLADFSPLSQDRGAIELIRERGELGYLTDGSIDTAIKAGSSVPPTLAKVIIATSGIWASLPGNSYGQGGHTLAAVAAKFIELRGSVA